jgi:hypothetical protein
MAKHGHKHSRQGDSIPQSHPAFDVIPSLGVDLPELQQQAHGLWQLNRFGEALILFEKAVQKYP